MAALAPVHERVASDLREERAAMQSLLDVLRSEQEKLVQGDADGVGALVASKSGQLQKLAGYAERRRVLLQSRHLPADASGMTEWLSDRPDAPVLAREWQALLELTRQAQQANDTNGALIAARLQSSHLALSALTTASRSTNLYGRDGHALGSLDRRRLGAA